MGEHALARAIWQATRRDLELISARYKLFEEGNTSGFDSTMLGGRQLKLLLTDVNRQPNRVPAREREVDWVLADGASANSLREITKDELVLAIMVWRSQTVAPCRWI